MTSPCSRLMAALVPLLFCTMAGAQQIESIEINQAIGIQKNNARKFVAGKDTAVRAFLTSEVEVDEAQTSATVRRNGEIVVKLAPVKSDESTSVVDFLCASQDACGNWAAGSYTFEVTVNGVTRQADGAYNFVERGPMRILALPVKANYGGKIVSVEGDQWKGFADYVRSVYPVATDKFFWVTRDEFDASDSNYDLETDDGQYNLWDALRKLIPSECAGNPNADGCFTQVFGFINDRPGGYPNGTLQGFTFGKPANIGVAKDEDAAATVAHEIGHTFGLGDTYDGGSFACLVNPAPDGYTGTELNGDAAAHCTAGRVALDGVSATLIPASVHPYEVGGRGALPDVGEYMGSGGNQEQFWVSQDGYDHIFDQLDPAAASSARVHALATPARFLECFGTIRENASAATDVEMEPCWSFEDTDSIPNTTGPTMMAAVNAGGARIASQALDLEFDVPGPKGRHASHLTEAPFGADMAFPADTAKIQFIRNGVVLREINVSPHSPVVSNVAPQIIGTVNGPAMITWTATDADGDKLSFEIDYNADVSNPNSDWEVLARDVDEQNFELDFSELPGSPHAQISVIASDGINSGEGSSLEFNVPPKPPDVSIEALPNGGVVFAGHEVILEGDAWDLEDDDIPESSLEWSSNLSGILGHGSGVRAVLPEGIHIITLAAKNSSGLTGTATATVRVVNTIRRRAVKR